MKSAIRAGAFLFLVCMLGIPLAHAQGVGSSGNVSGTVTDPSGAAVPKVTVTVTQAEKAIRRTAVTDDSGQYRVTGLLPSDYDVSAGLSGFQTAVLKGVVVNVGQTTIVDFQLKLSRVAETVEVSATPPVVDTERGSQSDIVDTQYIADLPINRRDYLTFTLLVPGVTNSTRLAGDQDFRVKQTPQSGLSFYGSNGRGNSVTVDGAEFNDDAGGVRPNLSQDAVQEFQVNRSNYAADLGGASGASINIVSKSGTNDIHGSFYGFFRNDALDAQDPFAFSQALQPGDVFNPAGPDLTGTPVKNSLSRQQFGGSIGFPIHKNKTFMFVALEGLRQDAQNAVPILTDTSIFHPETDASNNQQGLINAIAALPGNPTIPCLSGAPAMDAHTCALALTSALTISQFTGLQPINTALNQFIVNEFETNGGLFPYNSRAYLGSARLDHQFSEQDQVFFRLSFGRDNQEDPDVQSLTGFSRGSSVHALDGTLQGSWFHQFNPTTSNELRLQYSYDDFNVIPNAPGQAGLDIPGFANLGTQIFIPSFTIARRTEISDNITMVRGHHTMKFGFYELLRNNHTESHTFFPGRFVFGLLPGGLLSPCFVASAGGPNPCGLTTAGVNINSIQSVSLGLPQFFQQGYGNPSYSYTRPFTAAYWQDSWAIRPNLTLTFGLRYELDSQYGPLNTGTKNFGPRVSFAWDPFKDHKTVIRGGYGIFYSPIYAQIPGVVKVLGDINGTRQIAIFLDPLTGDPLNPADTSAAVFRTMFSTPVPAANAPPGTVNPNKISCTIPQAGAAACINAADLAPFGINVSNTAPLPPAPGAAPLPVIFSGQPGYASPYSQQLELGIERQIAPGFSVSASGVYVHTLRLPVAIDTNALPAPFSQVPLANGKIFSYRNWNGTNCPGGAFGTGATCFANPFLVQTDQYSSIGSAVYEGLILEIKKRFSDHFAIFANYTFSKAIDDSTDFNSDFGPVDNTNLAGERGLSTFDQRHKVVVAGIFDSPWKGPILSGFELSPIFTYNSAHPFNLLADNVDLNDDRHYTNDRPFGAGRNTGIGPNFFNFDMRLSRRFKVGEKATIQLLAEGFNIFNRTNYASVNNEVNPAYGLPTALGGLGNVSFNAHGSAALSPSQPLGFTSAFPKRQFQLGFRVSF
ncbi:MAG: TonB-dependent receptor [Candidatus Acidiferrales bacterium]